MKTHKQYRYRIYTENKNPAKVKKIVLEYFNGFTLLSGIGIWQGESEISLIVEIITKINSQHTIDKICKKINRANKQDCCLVTVEIIDVAYV